MKTIQLTPMEQAFLPLENGQRFIIEQLETTPNIALPLHHINIDGDFYSFAKSKNSLHFAVGELKNKEFNANAAVILQGAHPGILHYRAV